MSGKPILTVYKNDICSKNDICINEQLEVVKETPDWRDRKSRSTCRVKSNTREVKGETGRVGKDAVANRPARDRDRSLILEGGLSDIIRLLL